MHLIKLKMFTLVRSYFKLRNFYPVISEMVKNQMRNVLIVEARALFIVKVVRSVFLVDRVNVDKIVPSPCLSICILADGADGVDYCIGCFRTDKEIQDWYTFTNEEKEQIIEELPTRSDEF